MFDVKNKMQPDWEATPRGLGALLVAKIREGVVLAQLEKFQSDSILPSGVASFPIQSHCMLAVPWDFASMLELGCGAAGVEHGLLRHPGKLLFPPGYGLEALPPRLVEEAVALGADGAGDRVVGCNLGEGFTRCLPALPLNLGAAGGPAAVGVGWFERALVRHDGLELPHHL